MDESRCLTVALLQGSRSAVWLCVAILVAGCRVPDPPIVKDKSQGIVYDTNMEAEIKSGKAPVLVKTALAHYVETLSEPVAITRWSDESCQWNVFVATNRGRFSTNDDPQGENRVLNVPKYGLCEVTIPSRRRGTEPRTESNAKGAGLSFSSSASSKSADSGPLATVEATQLTEADFLEGVCGQVQRSRQHDLLVFVHGFNVSFDAAIARTAQLALDIPFNGAVVSYCWPSQCGVFNYQDDEPINKASVLPFTKFIKTLRTGVPDDTRIHIVVHSMGNRIVMESLNRLPKPRMAVGASKPFANVVLCAPDVGHSDFIQWAPGVVAQSERVSLYCNASDTALIASKSLHSEKRAGDAWGQLVVDGIETIDCSRIDLSFMGHSYYGSNNDVLTDLFMLIKEDRPAAKRSHLAKKKSAAGTHWQFANSAGTILCTWHFDE